MTSVALTSTVGEDGVLHLDIPLGAPAAGQRVQVLVSPVAGGISEEEYAKMTQQEWARWISSSGGTITDPTFKRHPQGEYEIRDPLE